MENVQAILYQWRIKMINLWDYANSKKVKITDINGKEFLGNVVAVFDKEETYDDEDSIDISVNGNYIGFFPSEIKKIEDITDE